MTAQLAPEEIQTTTTTQPAVSARPGWLRRAWHQIRATVAAFQDDGRQAILAQMPWGVDDKWHTK